jgi:hypothetical protein
MNKFEYTLPSGARFVVNGPSGSTKDQADRIFYEQVAAGSLIAYVPGQTLTSAATRLTKFELSRLDRGTAGVDSSVTIAITGIPVPGPSGQFINQLTPETTQTLLTAIGNIPVPVDMPSLADVALADPIDLASVVLIRGNDLEPDVVGPLSPFQVQKLLAQLALLVNQEFDQISLTKGIGRYGFTAYGLEQVGYVKPGTSLKYFSNGAQNFVAVMSSPSVWTGKDGVYSLNDLLDNPETQNAIQIQLMQRGYKQLTRSGTIIETPKPSVSLSSGRIYSSAGLLSLGNVLTPATNDFNLTTIGSGVSNTLLPKDINPAKINLNNITLNITNRLTGDIGALVTNASKFGSQAASLWAKSGGPSLDSISASITGLGTGGLAKLGSFAGQGFTNLTGSLTSGISNITSNLTNLVPPNLSGLTSNLDLFGKAGSFATNFANPLSSLNSLGGIGGTNLGGLLTAGGGIGGALTSQLGNLGNLGNLANLGNLGNLTNLTSLTSNLTNLGGLQGALSGLTGSLGSFASIGGIFGGGGDLVSGTQVAGGFNNTVNRQTVDAAFVRIVGSSKVPLPSYQYPSASETGPRLDILQAVNFLKNQATSATGTFGQTVTI